MSSTIHPLTAVYGVGRSSRDVRLVSFYLGAHQYGVDVDDVYGIYHGLPLIPMADQPECVDGEITVEGHRIPVVNLRRFAGLPVTTGVGSTPWVISINQPGGPIGLIVDRVTEVVRLETRAIESCDTPPVPVAEYVTAVAPYQGRVILLPDIGRLVQDAVR